MSATKHNSGFKGTVLITQQPCLVYIVIQLILYNPYFHITFKGPLECVLLWPLWCEDRALPLLLFSFLNIGLSCKISIKEIVVKLTEPFSLS